MPYLKLSIAALLPVVLSIFIFLTEKNTSFAKVGKQYRQIIYGILFGILSIIGTEWGIPYYGAQLNCRDAAVLTAGLMFGAPAGLIAGTIGAIERWFSVYWGVGYFTRVACTISTFIAGIYAALLRKYMFDDHKPEWLIAMAVGVVMEVFHLTMVFVTNMATPQEAMQVVRVCSLPMISANGISVMLSGVALSILSRSFSVKLESKKNSHISQIMQRWLLLSVIFAFAITSFFVIRLQTTIAAEQIRAIMPRTSYESYEFIRDLTNTSKNIVIYVNMYVEILIFAIMFAMIYILIKRVVVNQLRDVNDKLSRISSGNLDTVVDVYSNKEFSELSDDINTTVNTLKHYIEEAAARIDKELEVAREIQISSLPAGYPAFPDRNDFEIYADMFTAKEVGGDFYDYYMTDDNTLNFTIADVSGKGIPAAMFMMRAKTELNKKNKDNISLSEVFTAANNALCEGNDAEMFVTACQGRMNLKTGVLSFVNAGHNPPVIRHSDGTTELFKAKPGFVLAGMEGIKYKEQTIQLQDGDIFFMYTDGVTEATDSSNDLFGEERLLEAIRNCESTDMREFCQTVKERVDEFVDGAAQFDDISMVAFRYGDNGSKYYRNVSLNTIPEITEYVENKMQDAGLNMSVITKFNIAIDEIVSNIIKYGYNGKSGSVCIKLHISDSEVRLSVSDNAPQFNPLNQRDPDTSASAEDRRIGGLGLFMVKKSMDAVEYNYYNGWNILTLVKKL